MDKDDLSIIREAQETRLRDETIERAIGRAVRRNGHDFSRYIKIMSDLRDYAEFVGLSQEDAVSALLKEDNKQS